MSSSDKSWIVYGLLGAYGDIAFHSYNGKTWTFNSTRYQAHLAAIADAGANAVRHLTTGGVWNAHPGNKKAYQFCQFKFINETVGWDLSQWNEAYFDAVNEFIEIENTLGLTTFFCLADNCENNGSYKKYSPWWSNKNGVDGIYDTKARVYFDRFIDKCLSEFAGTNILWSSGNEMNNSGFPALFNAVIHPLVDAGTLDPDALTYGTTKAPMTTTVRAYLANDTVRNKVIMEVHAGPTSSGYKSRYEPWATTGARMLFSDDGCYTGASTCDKTSKGSRPSAAQWYTAALDVLTTYGAADGSDDKVLSFEHCPAGYTDFTKATSTTCQAATIAKIRQAYEEWVATTTNPPDPPAATVPIAPSGLTATISATGVSQSDLVSNGNFASGDTGWTVTAGWSTATGKCVHTTGTTAVTQSITTVTGGYYDCVVVVAGTTAGTLTVSATNTTGGPLAITADGTYTINFCATTTPCVLTFTPTTDFDGNFDDVTWKSTADMTVTLTWVDNSTTELDFHIEKSTTYPGTGGFTEIATVATDVVTYSATGLVSGTDVWFRVRAHNATGYSTYTNIAKATTPAATSMPKSSKRIANLPYPFGFRSFEEVRDYLIKLRSKIGTSDFTVDQGDIINIDGEPGGGELPDPSLGAIIYGDVIPEWVTLSGNITTETQFLLQVGLGTVSAAPYWSTTAQHLTLQDSVSPPYLRLTNNSDTECDTHIQHAVGATPVTKWVHGLDDSLEDDWLLCAGATLTKTAITETYEIDVTYDDYLFVADLGNNRIKRHMRLDLTYSSKIGSAGTGDDQFASPRSITSNGTHVYVADSNNHRIKKHLISDMSYVSKIGSSGSGDDNFSYPRGITNDGTWLYITDYGNNRVQKRLCSDLSYVTEANGNGINGPTAICTDGTYVYMVQNPGATYRIYKFLAYDMSLVLRVMPAGVDGYIDSCSILSMCTTGGYLYLVNSSSVGTGNIKAVYKYSCADLTYVTRFGDGGTGNGQFTCAYAITTDDTYLYVGDSNLADTSNPHRIQKLLLDGTYITKFGTYGNGDDNFFQIYGLSASGGIVKTVTVPFGGPILRAAHDAAWVDAYPLLRARDGFQLMEDGTTDATDYIGLYAPAAITTSYSLTFPGTGPSAAGHFAVDSGGLITWGQSVITTATVTYANITDSGLTASKPVFSDANKKLVSTGTMPVDQGGTGLASYAIGDIPYASAATTISKLADVATGSYLASGGVGVAPAYATLNQAAVAGLTTADGPSFDHLHLTVAIGTAPLVVTSTTAVSNLNVDLLDGLHSTSFIPRVISATAAPTVNDDIDNYLEGTIWVEQDANKSYVCVDNANGAAVWTEIGGAGASAFLDLTDVTEADYTGHAAQFVVVNAGETGLEFSAASVAGHAVLSASHTDSTAAAVVRGDMIAGIGATPKWTRVAAGTEGHIWTMGATEPGWAAAGGASHVLLSATHTDTLADTVVRGDVFIGNSTPKWSRYGKGAANQVLGGDGTDSKWVTACPAAAKYIVGLAHADLSAEKVKPQLYNNYDIDDTPAVPNALDDEFDDSSLDVKWTIVNDPGAPNAVSETAYAGFIWAGLPENTGTDNFDAAVRLYQTAPAGNAAATYIVKVCLGVAAIESSTDTGEFSAVGVYLGNSVNDEFVGSVVMYNNGPGDQFSSMVVGQANGASGAWGNTTFNNYQIVPAGAPLYLQLEKATTAAYASANTYNLYYSFNGIVWRHLGQQAKTFTTACDEVGVIFRRPKSQGGTPVAYGLCDFFRRTI